MDINGPLKVGVVEPTPQGNYELHITFADDFKRAGLDERAVRFRAYLGELGAALRGDLDGRTAQGILMIQQVCEELAPHIEADEVPLEDTMVIEIQRTPGVNLMDLLN